VVGSERAVTALLAAFESRDLRSVEAALSPAATWQNVPHPPAVGRRAVLELLGSIVTWCDVVRWDVVSASFGDDTA
jgi:limonene-1,2-epoxide hydrolase